MKAKDLGIFSAIFASICCLGPLILVLVGLGSLGIGAAIGKYHWWFLGGGILLLITAWSYYFKEKKSCDLKHCQMENKRLTQIILVVATLVVLFFIGLNLYAYLGKPKDINKAAMVKNEETVIIPVEGMTCFTCEVTVTSAIKRLDGVVSASASVSEKAANVIYDPNKTDINRLIEAINKTGYKASMPR
ncbi:MAG: cation transporter [Candidatus Omnitrophica bacterium]|nr:cation transporter [Candidatus Omnitrophota bacterium]